MSYTNAGLPNKNPSLSFSESLRRLLSRECKDLTDTVAIESAFKETTRDGKDILRFVRLALTSKAFVIACEKEQVAPSHVGSHQNVENLQELIKLYPWRSVKLSVFKKSKRYCVKVLFLDKSIRYFELRGIPKMKIYWHLWRRYIKELNNAKKKWPFTDQSIARKGNYNEKTQCIELCVAKPKRKKYPPPKWTNKYLYLGPTREIEDKNRPCPVPGLGNTEEIKLLYLKPEYFGCWEQSEHWVQCRESSSEFASQNNEETECPSET
ncbi:unnamed protein product [Arctia plantaginis]|uniref:Uncharacterized protein n=1 Tax=Arctia plantaginis TaxID=874455 RepID=A0A8S0ZVK6_ARCPL|nr:unnamed protein product [Arctia plantaginis]CAB3236254.1 unnamed protein product [Arctia plantaginis]